MASGMAGEIVAIPREEGILFINRQTLKAATVPLSLMPQLRKVLAVNSDTCPSWLGDTLDLIGAPHKHRSEYIGGGIFLKKSTNLDIRRVAWEITERCNLRCVHCYLGKKTRSGLALDELLDND